MKISYLVARKLGYAFIMIHTLVAHLMGNVWGTLDTLAYLVLILMCVLFADEYFGHKEAK